jgi:carbonic anhydrase
VHRNVGNVLAHADTNAMSALEYSVKARAPRCSAKRSAGATRLDKTDLVAVWRPAAGHTRIIVSACPSRYCAGAHCARPRARSCSRGCACAQVLGVKHVLVCGHTNCGAVKAALTLPSSSALLTNCWISQIRDIRNQHVDELVKLPLDEQVAHLVKLNVMKQVFNVCTSPVLQQVWEAGSEVYVHGLVYDVSSGGLSRLVGPLGGNDEVPEDLGAATSFPDTEQMGGHTLNEALRRLASALGGDSNPDARVLLQSLSGKGDASKDAEGSGGGSQPGEAAPRASGGGGAVDDASMQALLELAQRMSTRSGGASPEASMDTRVLSKMQSHLAFEAAAKSG